MDGDLFMMAFKIMIATAIGAGILAGIVIASIFILGLG